MYNDRLVSIDTNIYNFIFLDASLKLDYRYLFLISFWSFEYFNIYLGNQIRIFKTAFLQKMS